MIELLNEFLTMFNFQVLNYNLQIGYDRRVRPNYGNSPVFVKVSLYVLSVEVIVDRVYCQGYGQGEGHFYLVTLVRSTLSMMFGWLYFYEK